MTYKTKQQNKDIIENAFCLLYDFENCQGGESLKMYTNKNIYTLHCLYINCWELKDSNDDVDVIIKGDKNETIYKIVSLIDFKIKHIE